jgi:hypothetical protein
MRCERCGGSALLLAHDAAAASHVWSEDAGEMACECQPEPVCSACESARLRDAGFLLLPRPLTMRALAPASQMRH